MARMLREDPAMLAFFNGESSDIPPFFEARIRKDLGPLWDALPEGALHYDHNAYLKSQAAVAAE
jgi:hypothetical protein